MIRLIAILLAILLAFPAAAQVRKNVNALTTAEIAALRTGFRVMAERNNAPRNSAAYRTSLEFWANMHGHPGGGCAPAVAGMESFTATNAAERDMWCSCEHGSDRFLTWHRIFMAHFERVFVAASGMPSLRLPYWDSATLPTTFRTPTANNPLYRAGRSMNGGQALAAAVRSSANAMAATNYSSFNARLESSPHGAIHTAVGGLMRRVSTAGLDPIFWLHHSRVDRDYEAWLRAGGRQPTAGLDVRYAMISPSGGAASARVGDWLALRTPYDNLPAVGVRMAQEDAARVKPRMLRVTIVHDPAPGTSYLVVHVAPDGTRTDLGVIGGFGVEAGDGSHSHGRTVEFAAPPLVGGRLEFRPTTGLAGDAGGEPVAVEAVMR